MSDGNWSVRVAVVGALAALTLTTLGTGAYFGALNAPHYGYQTAHSAHRSPQAEDSNPSQIDRDRAGLPYFAERIASGPDPDDADEREKRDLAAQESVSVWTFWILILSAVTTMATIIGTGLLIWTLWETRSTARRELRAYVSVKVASVSVTHIEGKGLLLSHEIVSHNGGATPAYDCVHFGTTSVYSAERAARELDEVKPINEADYKGGAVIHSGEDFPVEPGKPVLIPFALIELIKAGKLNIYNYGVASYIDTFGIRRRTDYCYRLSGEPFIDALNYGETETPIPVKWNVAPFHNSAS